MEFPHCVALGGHIELSTLRLAAWQKDIFGSELLARLRLSPTRRVVLSCAHRQYASSARRSLVLHLSGAGGIPNLTHLSSSLRFKESLGAAHPRICHTRIRDQERTTMLWGTVGRRRGAAW